MHPRTLIYCLALNASALLAGAEPSPGDTAAAIRDLGSVNPARREAATTALVQHGATTASYVCRAGRNLLTNQRRNVIPVLGRLAVPEAQVALAQLALSDPDADLRTAALATLPHAHPPLAVPARDYLITQAVGDRHALRTRALNAMSALGANQFVAPLIQQLDAGPPAPAPAAGGSGTLALELTNTEFVGYDTWNAGDTIIRQGANVIRIPNIFRTPRFSRTYVHTQINFPGAWVGALQTLTGQEFANDPAAWKRWYAAQPAAASAP